MKQILKENLIRVKLKLMTECYKVYLKTCSNETDLLNNIARKISEKPSILVLYCDNIDDEDFITFIEKVKLLCAEFNSVFLINKRIDIAFIVDADGVYLDCNSMTPYRARQILGENKFICQVIHEPVVDSYVDFISTEESLIIDGRTINIWNIAE